MKINKAYKKASKALMADFEDNLNYNAGLIWAKKEIKNNWDEDEVSEIIAEMPEQFRLAVTHVFQDDLHRECFE